MLILKQFFLHFQQFIIKNQIGIRFDGRTNSFSPVNDYDNSLQTNQQLRLMKNRSSVTCKGKFAEFFAVATETFFEKSREFQEHHPELYGLFTRYYRQDPLSWDS